MHVAAVNLAGALILTSSLLVSAPDSVCRPGAVPESLAVDLEKVNFNHFATMLIREWRGHAPPALYIRLGINNPDGGCYPDGGYDYAADEDAVFAAEYADEVGGVYEHA